MARHGTRAWWVCVLACACADITPIEDGQELNRLVVIQDWFTSIAVLPHDSGVALFDAGFREGRIETALQTIGFAPDDVTDVFVTHGHGDHIGALGAFPDAVVHALPEEQPLLDGAGVRAVALDPVVRVERPPFVIEVLPVPGHTPGSAAYLVDGVLVLGDAALVDAAGNLVPVPEGRSEDPQGAEASLVQLAQLLAPRTDQVAWVWPSHSRAVSADVLADWQRGQLE